MIILALALILTGSIAGAVTMWLQDASFWQVVLGYFVGGWSGLLLGMPVVLALRFLVSLFAPVAKRRSGLASLKRQHPEGR
jgi:hypothetical protein